MMDQTEILAFMKGMSSSIDLDRREAMIEKAEAKTNQLTKNIHDINNHIVVG